MIVNMHEAQDKNEMQSVFFFFSWKCLIAFRVNISVKLFWISFFYTRS